MPLFIGGIADTAVIGDNNNIKIDELPLDYDILEEISYKYPAADNYFAYTTRGCPNKCSFCAVPLLEPDFYETNNIIEQISIVENHFDPKRNLILLDNNILNAPNLASIVDDLCKAGFYRGAKYKDPDTYAITMKRYKNGERMAFLDRNLKEYLYKFRRRVKSPTDLDKHVQIIIDADEAENYAEFMLQHEATLTPLIKNIKIKFINLDK